MQAGGWVVGVQASAKGDGSTRYEAFISYSHTEYDARIAREVQRFIEEFSIPSALRAQAGRARLGRVFRDEDELGAGGQLAAGLDEALRCSRWLVVVCSPAAAASPWVAREIETFISYHGRERVLAVLASGDQTTAFPPAFVTSAGTPCTTNEPVAADLRASVPRRRRHAELLRLAAPLVGCAYDELAQRRRTRARRRVALAAVVALLCIGVVGGVVISQRRQVDAVEERAEATRARREALDIAATGDRVEALRLAVACVPEDDSAERAEARVTLAQVLGVYHPVLDTKPLYALHDVADASTLAVSAEGDLLSLLDSPERIRVYDMATGAVCSELDAGKLSFRGERQAFASLQLLANGHLVTLLDADGVACFDARSGALAWQQYAVGNVHSIRLVAGGIPSGGDIVVVGWRDGACILSVLDGETGDIVRSVPLEDVGHEPALIALAVRDDTAVIAANNMLVQVDLAAGSVQSAPLAAGDVTGIVLDDTGVYTVSSDLASEAGAEDTWTGAATICAYERDGLGLRWSFGRTWEPYELASSISPFNADAQIGRVERSDALGEAVLPLAVGSELLLVDVMTGAPKATFTAAAPIVHFDFAAGESGAEALRATTLTGERCVADVGAGDARLASFDPYRFPCSVWHAEERIVGTSRYAIACSADDLKTILVYRDDPVVPQESGVERIDVSGVATGASVSAYRDKVAIFDGADAITVLDGEDFDPVATIGLTQHGIELTDLNDALITFPDADSGLLLVCDAGTGAMPPRAWLFDALSGELVRSWVWPYAIEGIAYDGCTFSQERGGCVTLMFPAAGYLGLIDVETLEAVQEFTITDTGITDVLAAGDDRLLVVFEGGATGLYDWESMERIDSALDGMTFASTLGTAQVAVAPDGATLAAISPEEGVTVVDVQSGDRLWGDAIEVAGGEYIAYSSDGNYVLVQDAAGVLRCYNAEDGELVAQTEDALDSVFAIDTAVGSKVFAVHTTDTVTTSLQVYELDAATGAFHLIASVPQGLAISSDGSRLLACGTRLYRQPVYSLEELVQMAEETIAEYESR